MATTYLSHTMSTPTARTKSTISAWLKKTSLGANSTIFGGGDAVSECAFLNFNTNDKLYFQSATSDSADWGLTTDAVFKDPSAWYHVVVKVDTTQSTSSDRVKMYVNGTLQTVTGSYPSQNYDMQWSRDGEVQLVGKYPATGIYFNGVMAHVHFTDGYAYDASTFGETDSTSGIWVPKTNPSVTYGTNGFFLKFENSGAMGTDSSGQSNTFSVSGTLTQNVDTPSNNFASGLSIANGADNLTLTNANNTMYDTDSNWRSGFGSIGPSSGKWYFEVKMVGASSNVWIGIMDPSQMNGLMNYKFMEQNRGYGYSAGGEKGNNSSTTASWGASYAQNDIVGVAMDLDNDKIYFSKNGTWQDSGDPTSGSTGTGSAFDLSSGYNYLPATSLYSTTAGVSFNFGQGYFGTTQVASSNADANGHGLMEYAVPTGYYTLNTKNLKEFG